jgi:hypothetical protein
VILFHIITKSITQKKLWRIERWKKNTHVARHKSCRNGRAFCLMLLIGQALSDTIQKHWPTELNHFHASIPQTICMKCSEAKWQACCFSDNWKKSGRFFKSDSVCMCFAGIQKHKQSWKGLIFGCRNDTMKRLNLM